MKHVNIFYAAVGDLARRPGQLCLLVICLAAAVFPLFAALGVSEGVKAEAEVSLREGADVFVSRDVYGAEGAIPINFKDQLAALTDVAKVRPRVVGRTYFGDRVVAVVGLDNEGLLALGSMVDGRVPTVAGEVLVGHALAASAGITPGLKFTLAAHKSKLLTVVGTLHPVGLWTSDLLVMSITDANDFFFARDLASHILVYMGPNSGYAIAAPPGLRLHQRPTYESILKSGFSWTKGIFAVLLIMAAGLAVPSFLVTSGLGRREFRREFGTMKAMGWTTPEVLEKTILQNMITGLMAASLAVVVCVLWMRGCNGIFISQFFIAEIGLVPRMEVPFRPLPIHGLVCLAFTLFITGTGGLYAAWTGSRIPPVEAMKY